MSGYIIANMAVADTVQCAGYVQCSRAAVQALGAEVCNFNF
ncbi:MAG: hypothetical protein RIS34_659 [Pseudomonadota bacterium]|jgi:uncharacterized protein (DUF1330 family)